MPTNPPAPESVAAGREIVAAIQWDKIYAEARRRTMSDMTGSFYDEHLARTLADHICAALQAKETK